MTTLTITKHASGKYVLVDSKGTYAAEGGGRYFGYDPATDPHAVRQALKEIRDELDICFASHKLPARWPKGEQSIAVECRPY